MYQRLGLTFTMTECYMILIRDFVEKRCGHCKTKQVQLISTAMGYNQTLQAKRHTDRYFITCNLLHAVLFMTVHQRKYRIKATGAKNKKTTKSITDQKILNPRRFCKNRKRICCLIPNFTSFSWPLANVRECSPYFLLWPEPVCVVPVVLWE